MCQNEVVGIWFWEMKEEIKNSVLLSFKWEVFIYLNSIYTPYLLFVAFSC